MAALFVVLVGMLVGGAGISLGIMAHDRSRATRELQPHCSADE